MTPFENFIPPAQFPTWHERSYAPGTPQSMWFVLQDEAKEGSEGQFGHHYWAERHPAYTEKLMGYVWLPTIKFNEVPGHMRGQCVIDYRDGRVFLRAIVDGSMVPAWMS
jgi:hypothetical protein